MQFIDQDYELPKKEGSNRYLNKFEVGDTRIRILASPKLGYEWTLDENGELREGKYQKGDKPVRVGMKGPMSPSEFEAGNHFWAMPIYNYNLKCVQIAKVTSYKIQSTILAYAKDEDWGSPVNYDLLINRVGLTFNDTKYTVIAKPAKPLSPEIKDEYESLHIDMDAWMRSEDPFKQETAPSDQATATEAVKALK